jgi:hypothetical protein
MRTHPFLDSLSVMGCPFLFSASIQNIEEIKQNKLETRTATWRKRHNSQHNIIHSNVTYFTTMGDATS